VFAGVIAGEAAALPLKQAVGQSSAAGRGALDRTVFAKFPAGVPAYDLGLVLPRLVVGLDDDKAVGQAGDAVSGQLLVAGDADEGVRAAFGEVPRQHPQHDRLGDTRRAHEEDGIAQPNGTLHGRLAGILGPAAKAKGRSRPATPWRHPRKLVAGAGFEPATFRL